MINKKLCKIGYLILVFAVVSLILTGGVAATFNQGTTNVLPSENITPGQSIHAEVSFTVDTYNLAVGDIITVSSDLQTPWQATIDVKGDELSYSDTVTNKRPSIDCINILNFQSIAKVTVSCTGNVPTTAEGKYITPLSVTVKSSDAGESGTIKTESVYVQSGYGVLVVSSSPSDATIFIDGVNKGKTPASFTLSNGSHTVNVVKSGYDSYTTTTTIFSGKTTTISAELTSLLPDTSETMPANGTILITSTPSGAVAYIDGKTYGVTPLVNTPLSTGSHQITLKLDGYEDWSKELYITENNSTKVIATLNKKSDSSGITLLSPPFFIAIIAILVCGIVAVVIVTTKSSRRKRNCTNTVKPSEKTASTAKSVHTSETKQVTNTNIKNETKTEVKGGDTIINIHAENYVAGNVGTIAKDDAVVNRSDVDVFEQVRKCPYCGSDISADSDFCGKCGRRLR